ncbi:uncharacterized protein NPIL_191771 [Nephila pilipes]|uniref:Uncharacterized protein n=1 Tax=Nephila pilipes TaxID=299642 RepID=A0A8X6PYW3_NEPPI|nr:uncharacterized protein NPIL_191771 [Nephila pilipes]
MALNVSSGLFSHIHIPPPTMSTRHQVMPPHLKKYAYKLGLCWYFTTPALLWDAMLLHTKVTMKLITDYDILLFIENGIRGGISQGSNRYAITNNKYMPNFNPDVEIKYLMYLS